MSASRSATVSGFRSGALIQLIWMEDWMPGSTMMLVWGWRAATVPRSGSGPSGALGVQSAKAARTLASIASTSKSPTAMKVAREGR